MCVLSEGEAEGFKAGCGGTWYLPCIGKPRREVDCDCAAVEWSIGERHAVEIVCKVGFWVCGWCYCVGML